jgi:hypothetical protein
MNQATLIISHYNSRSRSGSFTGSRTWSWSWASSRPVSGSESRLGSRLISWSGSREYISSQGRNHGINLRSASSFKT